MRIFRIKRPRVRSLVWERTERGLEAHAGKGFYVIEKDPISNIFSLRYTKYRYTPVAYFDSIRDAKGFAQQDFNETIENSIR